MNLEITREGSKATIKCGGHFDFHAHREFRQAYEQLPATQVTHIRLDLSTVTYLDSSALGMMLMLRDRHPSATVSILVSPGPVKQVLDIANFGKMFQFE